MGNGTMQCAFCKEEMNAGATVCKTCAREQPTSTKRRSDRNQRTIAIVVSAVAAFAVAAFSAWKLIDMSLRASAVQRIVECAHLHGDKDMNTAFVNNEID